MVRSTGAEYQCHFRRRGRDQSAGRAPARGRPRRAAHARRADRGAAATAIRNGALRAGAQVPSTRDLARQLGISRRVAVEAYAQLAAEGYLSTAPGRAPARVRDRRGRAPATPRRRAPARRRRASTSARACPTCPRSRAPPGCGRCARRSARSPTPSSATATRAAIEVLRAALADYLGRVRGVVADPDRVVVTSGYSQGARTRLPGARRARRAADRDRGPEQPRAARDRRAGGAGAGAGARRRARDRGRRARRRADAVVVTPAHQHPTGVVLSPERRAALLRLAARRTTRSRSRTTTTPSTATTAPRSARCRGSSPSASSTPARRARRSRRRCGSAGSSCPARWWSAVRARSCSPTAAAADRAARVRRLPRARGARPPPAPHARPLPRAARRAGRGARPRSCRRPTVPGIAAGLHVTVGCPRRRGSRSARGGRAAADRPRDDARLPPARTTAR